MVLWQGAELYKSEAGNSETLKRFGHRTPRDWLERKLYTRFQSLGVILMLMINLLLFGVIGLTVWAVQMMWIPFFAAGVINGIGHSRGYRNFECQDAARNIFPWGILIGGEELHNNHHTYPNSARLSVRKWEIDIGWLWIRFFSRIGLAKVKHLQPLASKDITKNHIDNDTVMAVINNRFQIMNHYRKQVIVPLVKLEYKKAEANTRRLLRSAIHLLAREEFLLAHQHHEAISRILEASHTLKTIYQKTKSFRPYG